MSTWFGKGCPKQICQWEENEVTGGPNFRENTPALIYCSDPRNRNRYEGNCFKENCPDKCRVCPYNPEAK
jgi:hypothetical protein